MINANELRIGNYLIAQEPEHNGKAFAIDAGDILEIRKGTNTYKYATIPLTPEILEKCGFRWYDNEWYEIKDKVHLSVSVEGAGYIYFGKGEYLFKSNIKHLHQLQNLYFALTNNELNIQL